jgi:hypothetical protein
VDCRQQTVRFEILVVVFAHFSPGCLGALPTLSRNWSEADQAESAARQAKPSTSAANNCNPAQSLSVPAFHVFAKIGRQDEKLGDIRRFQPWQQIDDRAVDLSESGSPQSVRQSSTFAAGLPAS